MKKSKNCPLVSIIIATYNRSELLYYAIQSVRQSTYNNWELIVVGDCCTDDTEEVVNSFKDDRIHFMNLSKNSGQQATPNNEGGKIAKGDYIGYLNQDDLYLPYHLEYCVKLIQQENCDMICCPYVDIMPFSKEEFHNERLKSRLIGYHSHNTYQPNVFQVASSWFLKKELLDKVGLWKKEKQLFVTPSQEWLFRANKKKANIFFSDRIGVFTLFTGLRKGIYLKENLFEHKFVFNKLKDAKFVSRMIEKAGLLTYGEVIDDKYNNVFKHFYFALLLPIMKLLTHLNIHPQAFPRLIRFGGKGGFIKYHNRFVKTLTQRKRN